MYLKKLKKRGCFYKNPPFFCKMFLSYSKNNSSEEHEKWRSKNTWKHKDGKAEKQKQKLQNEEKWKTMKHKQT